MSTGRSKMVATSLVAITLVLLVAGLVVAQTGRVRIVIAATHYSAIKPSTAVHGGDSNAVNGKWIEYPLRRPHATSENPAIKGDGGYALYKVKIPSSGQYWVWARGWWQDGCGNSWFLVVDNKAPQVIGQDGTYQTWKWRYARQAYALSPGVHTFKLQNREDGARIDEILITTDARYLPQGKMAETPGYLVK